MAVTQNTYTGNGSTTNYSFTFPYLETTDIKVSVNGTNTTAYTLANATTIQFNTAPANGAAIRIYRQTDDTALAAAFYPGSAIRSADLNDNFTQNLYVTQESNRDATQAISTANAATTTANSAVATANGAVATANTASSNAAAAVATANTASSNASAAVSTANTASSNATAAVNTANAATATANSAAADAATAISTANGAVSTANSAVSTANSAVTTAGNAVTSANSAVSSATAAVSTANTASTNASNAVTTANTASSNASTALSTANSALSTANAAASAVANAILYDTVANVAAIPASPTNNDAVEVVDSTGIESFTPLSGKPAGFVGDSGLSVRIVYTTTGSTWNWIQYFPNDPENRYGDAITTLQTDLNTAEADILALDSAKLDSTTAASTYQTQAGMTSYLTTSAAGSTYAPLASPTFTGTPTGPSFTVTGSTAPTNGVYLPAANSVAISTGGSQRLTIDASGRLLAGASTSSSVNRAVFQGNSTLSTGTAIVQLSLGNSSPASGDQLGRFQFTDSNQESSAEIIAARDGGTWNTSTSRPTRLVLSTTADGASSPTERLRITSAGLVGIGTTAPSDLLHVRGVAPNIRIDGGTSPGTYGVKVYGDATEQINFTYNNQTGENRIGGVQSYIFPTFFSGGSERARIDTSGRLLVGTSSGSLSYSSVVVRGNPAASGVQGTLELSRASLPSTNGSGIGTIAFTDSSSNLGATIAAIAEGSWTSGSNHRSRLEFSTTSDSSASPSERLRIASTGALGLSGANYGSAGQVLTSQGSGAAPQWVTPAGAWTYISSVTASSSATVDITSGINSTYDVYMLTITNVTFAVTGYELLMRTSSNGGSSYDSAANEYGWTHNPFVVSDSSTSSGNGTNGSHIRISRGNVSVSDGGKGLNSVIYIYKPSRSDNCLFSFSTTQHVTPISATPAIATFNGLGVRRGSSAVNALRFIMADASNINSGVFRLYGLKNS